MSERGRGLCHSRPQAPCLANEDNAGKCFQDPWASWPLDLCPGGQWGGLKANTVLLFNERSPCFTQDGLQHWSGRLSLPKSQFPIPLKGRENLWTAKLSSVKKVLITSHEYRVPSTEYRALPVDQQLHRCNPDVPGAHSLLGYWLQRNSSSA